MSSTTYLIFGDLHGRVLPAFRLSQVWAREHEVAVAGLLQVGDLGYYPDLSRLDKATIRHAAADPLELGVQLITVRSRQADSVFHGDEAAAEALWFTVGNHEDFEAIAACGRNGDRSSASFSVDAYGRARCIRDGEVEALPGGLRVGALWGIDDRAPNARRKTPMTARIRDASLSRLVGSRFDVLLTHDGPRDAVLVGSGSEGINDVLEAAQPAFAFFGHYGSRFGPIAGDFGGAKVHQLAGFELRRSGSCAEAGSVGRLTWLGDSGTFEYLDERWLRSFTRDNWQYR